jgi:hypothetical protein
LVVNRITAPTIGAPVPVLNVALTLAGAPMPMLVRAVVLLSSVSVTTSVGVPVFDETASPETAPLPQALRPAATPIAITTVAKRFKERSRL